MDCGILHVFYRYILIVSVVLKLKWRGGGGDENPLVDGADGDGEGVVVEVFVVVVGEEKEVVATCFLGDAEEAGDFSFAGFLVLDVVGYLDGLENFVVAADEEVAFAGAVTVVVDVEALVVATAEEFEVDDGF